ncbi:MAG: hypothetical protein JWN40_813 [Phycisphaerales bacterium]|nr:hypothetical protein [Phycisphaerales bacterium]
MSASLSNDDRCAVDLLLENAQPPSQGISSCFTKGASSTMQARLTRVESLLRLLDNDIAPEPASDLAARTVSRCTERGAVLPQTAQILPSANA